MQAFMMGKMPDSHPTGRRERLREDLEKQILACAEKIFAEFGFEGSSLADIAEAAGVSKQNLIYYYPSKLALYRSVLDGVLADWLGEMRVLANSALSPRDALGAYLRAKLNFSRRRPYGSRVYAMEVISGAKTYGGDIKDKVVPALREDIATLNGWIKAGQVRAISAQHLFFIIWAATQTYADFAPQMQLFLNKKSLSDSDFEEAYSTLQILMDAIWIESPTGSTVGDGTQVMGASTAAKRGRVTALVNVRKARS